MRDYSFGNYISVLRERRGLSQFQLGALVGVSDKAEWQNYMVRTHLSELQTDLKQRS